MTDAVVVDEEGSFLLGKHLTNKQDESVSFPARSAMRRGRPVATWRSTLSKSEVIVYAGTIMLNMLLSRSGATSDSS